MVRSPGLLAADLTEKNRLSPLSGSLTVKMTGSGEASFTLPEGAPAVAIHDLVSIYTERGLAGIYRVTNVAQNYKKQIDVTLLHAIDILSDSVWAAQTTFEGTRTQYITALLNQQTTLINGVKPWAVGTCQDTETVKKDINYDRLSDLLEEMEEDGGDYYFVYDFSVFPWTVSYMEKPNNAACEFRLTRNIRSATTTYNDADLCTRLHLAVNTEKTENNVTSTVTTIRTYNNTEAQATWGIVVKTADIDTNDKPGDNDFTEADAWAAAFLARRREPTVQIQIDGDELKGITGDTWDEYSVGKKCQVALPDYNQSFTERVISVTYPDLFKDPEHVTVSLANNLPKFSENLTDARKNADDAKKKAASAARGSAKVKDLTTWSQIVSYQGAALDGTGVMTLWQSGIDMDAQGGVRIFSLQEGLQSLYAGIEVTASQIRAEVSTGLNGIHSELLMTASQIKAEVDNSLSGIATFVIEADQIRAEVKDALSNLGSLIVESSQIRAEVQDALSNIAQFEVTASQIRQEVADNVNSLRASIILTASQIRQEMSDQGNSLRSSITVTASQIRQEVSDGENSLRSSISVTASQIRQEVSDQGNSLRASISTTANEIRADVEDNLNDVRASIDVTASQIRQEVTDSANDINASITLTANQIRQEVSDQGNSLRSSISVTASQIRQEVSDQGNSIRSTISVTASQIRQEVSDQGNSLRSSISTTAGRIALLVDGNGVKGSVIVDAINGQSQAMISADKITLDGSTTVSGILSVQNGAMVVSVPSVFNNSVQIFGQNTLSTSSLQIVGGGQGETYNLNADKVKNFITELQVASSGNAYWLEKKTVYNSSTWTKIENSDFNRGSVAVLTGAWDRSTHTYTVTAPGSTPASTTVGMTGNGQQDSFTVSAFADGVTTDTVNSINGFLVVTTSSNKTGNKAEVRLNSKTGTSSILVSSVTLGDVYDAGANNVTLSKAWSTSGTFTVTPSNGKTPVTTTVGLTAAGQNDSATVYIYRDGNTNSTVKSENLYLKTTSSTTRTANKTELWWHATTGTGSLLLSSVTLGDVFDKGAASVTLSKAWSTSGTFTVTPSNGKTPVTTTVGLTAAGQNESATVYIYRDGNTSSTVRSENLVLTATTSTARNSNKANLYWHAASGTGSQLLSSITLGDVYDKGADSVTLSGAWVYDNTGVYTVTASNGKTKSTTIHLTTKRMGESNTSTDYFPIWVYNGSSTANNIKEQTIYLTEEVSTARSNCRVLAHWGSAGGTTYGRIFTTNTFDAGADSVTLSKSWSTSGTFTVTPSNGKTPVTTTVGLTAAGQNDSATVYIYRDGNTSSTVKSENLYLVTTASSTKANNKVDLRFHSKTGTGSLLIATASNVGDIYDKGAASVTLSDAWNNNKYTVTASNAKTKSTTIGLTADGDGSDNFTVSAYHDAAANTVKSEYIYLVDNTSQHRVEARWASSTGTVYGQKTYTQTSHNITCSNVSPQPGTASTAGRTNAKSGGISRPPANGYVFFTISCGGTSKNYYIPINT